MEWPKNHPTALHFGEAELDKNAAAIEELGERVLIMTGKSGAVASGALADVLQILSSNDQTFRIFDGISENPLVSSVRKAAEEAKSFEADFILAIGGGSVVDAAKGAALLATNDFTDDELFSKEGGNSPLPIVAVGITAGTGSEVTDIAVLTQDETGRKKSLRRRDLYPALAFADYRYTQSMGERTTVSTALDALCHLLESYFSPEFDESLTNFCFRGIGLACRQLARLEESSKAYEAKAFRQDMTEAALLGGYAIDRCRTSFPHLAGYALTEEKGLPHGLACAAFLSPLMQLAEEYASEKCEALQVATGFSTEEIARLADYLVQKDFYETGFTYAPNQLENQLARYEQGTQWQRTPGQVPAETLLAMAEEQLMLLQSE